MQFKIFSNKIRFSASLPILCTRGNPHQVLSAGYSGVYGGPEISTHYNLRKHIQMDTVYANTENILIRLRTHARQIENTNETTN